MLDYDPRLVLPLMLLLCMRERRLARAADVFKSSFEGRPLDDIETGVFLNYSTLLAFPRKIGL